MKQAFCIAYVDRLTEEFDFLRLESDSERGAMLMFHTLYPHRKIVNIESTKAKAVVSA